ncbi:GNAT family N-acyltransferase [Rhabdaerophilum sp. SD176]|uniref:GNAT family N-acetyltransferase n=1 Tax=Rhabdaerophilum sp. SD176 TaxID=2983548 RepID=UPI0024DFBA74|nr:GNAT family N-acyltransferase [Rhabdaerophilum sp. SD176]
MLRPNVPGAQPSPAKRLRSPFLDPRALVGRLNPTNRIVRDGGGLPDSLGRIGSLEVRLARTTKDIRRAQRLRYNVFFEEMSATPNARNLISRRDVDPFDRICDHLLVIDHEGKTSRFGKPKPKVIGTYRLLRSEVAAAQGTDFYTAGEYDLGPLLAANRGARMLELGRSCVLKPWRTKRTVELLWHGIWRYVLHHKIELMFGCASLEGTDPDALALPLAFLHHHARAPEGLSARALPWRHTPMDRMEKDAIDLKAAMKTLPPLIKGYLRLGALFGEGAVIDRQFGTTDVFVVVKVSAIDPRYIAYYGADASRHTA